MALRNPIFSNNKAFSTVGGGQTVQQQWNATGQPPYGQTAFDTQQAQAVASAAGLQQLYNAPSAGAAETDRMTVEDSIQKTVILFIVLLVGAAVGWFIPALTLPAAIAGFVLAIVNSFKRNPSPALIITYAAVEGIFVGGISAFFEMVWGGVVMQAVLATLVVFGVTLALFASGKVRASAKATKIFMIALVGYLVFSLINVGMMLFGATDMAFGMRSATIPGIGIPFGIVIGLLAVLLAAYSLVLDFDFIKRGAENNLPRKMGWYGAFGLMVTLVWLYIEFLRIFAIARD